MYGRLMMIDANIGGILMVNVTYIPYIRILWDWDISDTAKSRNDRSLNRVSRTSKKLMSPP